MIGSFRYGEMREQHVVLSCEGLCCTHSGLSALLMVATSSYAFAKASEAVKEEGGSYWNLSTSRRKNVQSVDEDALGQTDVLMCPQIK